MRTRLREREYHSRRWTVVFDEAVDPAAPVHANPLTLNEGAELSFSVELDGRLDADARLYVGDVLLASSRRADRPEFLLRPGFEDDGLVCIGRLFRDWVGQTELRLDVAHHGVWKSVLFAPVFVTASKMAQETFEALCADIATHSAAILLDVYGKTFVGLEPERRMDEAAPVAVLGRMRQTLDQLAASFRAIANQPAYRLKTTRVREPVLAEQSVSDLTLEEVCTDPTLAVPHRGGVMFREHVREQASPHYDLPEHRLLSAFLHFLSAQIADLRSRMEYERQERIDRRAYRHRRTAQETKTWWEQEDLPRIEELQRLLSHLDAMDSDLAQLRRHRFLPPAGRLTEVPASTPLFRSHRAYASAFKVLTSHFTAYRVRLDESHLLTRAKSLPVLYEWWCVLEVMRILQGCLRLIDAADRASPFRRLEGERDRFVIELAPDRTITFADEQGRTVRMRYVPSYRPWHHTLGAPYGLLGSENERTPDISLEVFTKGQTLPELIVVLDAKYSSDPHHVKLEEVRLKYSKIGEFRTGRVLSRQVWALAPMSSRQRAPARPEWASFCTVDNLGFWSDQYDMQSSVAGVVQAVPRMPAGRSPLESLLRLLLRRSGLVLRGEAST